MREVATQISDDASALLAIEDEIKSLAAEERAIQMRRAALLVAYDQILANISKVSSVGIIGHYDQRGAYVGFGMGRPRVGLAAN